MSRDPIRETLREVLSLQGTEEPVYVAPPVLSSDEETEGEAEQQVATEAKASQTRAQLDKSMELLGVFPAGIERGYCVIPRGYSSSGIARKRRVVQIVLEDAHVGSTVLALWNDNHRHPGAAAAAAFAGTPQRKPAHALADTDLGEAKFWPATIKRFTGEYVGLTNLADGALRSFADFDLVEDHANTLPFLLCVDMAFAVDESESRQRLVWSGDVAGIDGVSSSTKAAPNIMSPNRSGPAGAMVLLPSILPSVLSVRNYSVVDASRQGAAITSAVGTTRRGTAVAVENPLVGGPISGNDVVFERAHKSRRFTVLTVRDAGVVVQAKQQALRDLRDRWRRARAALAPLSPKASSHSLSGATAAPEQLSSSRVNSQAALRTPEPAAKMEIGHSLRRRAAAGAGSGAPPAPPTFGAAPRGSATEPHPKSFVDLHDVGSAQSLEVRPLTLQSQLEPKGSVCESPPRSERLHAKSQVNAPRIERRVQGGEDTVPIPRLQGAATIGHPLHQPVGAHHQALDTVDSLVPQRAAVHVRSHEPHNPSSILVVSHQQHPLTPPPAQSSPPRPSGEDDGEDLVEEKVEQLEEELAMLRKLLTERHHKRVQHAAAATAVTDTPLKDTEGVDDDHDTREALHDGASPAPVPRGDAPRPRAQSPVAAALGGGHPRHPSPRQSGHQKHDSIKLWRKAQDTTSFPPNSYVYVDPHNRSTSPFDASGRSQIEPQQQRLQRGGIPSSTHQQGFGSGKRVVAMTSLATATIVSSHFERTPGASTIPVNGRTPQSAIGIDAHYHRSLAYKETVKRSLEDVKKKGLDVVRRQQTQHAALFRRDTRELDSSPVLQRKQKVIDRAERSASRSPLGSRTPSVASRGGVSPFRTLSPTQQQQAASARSRSNDVFTRLSQPSASKTAQGRPTQTYVPPPPINGRSGSATRGIVAAVSGATSTADRRVRRSISPDFDVTAPADDDAHNVHFSRTRQPHHAHDGHHRVFHMPTLAKGFQS